MSDSLKFICQRTGFYLLLVVILVFFSAADLLVGDDVI